MGFTQGEWGTARPWSCRRGVAERLGTAVSKQGGDENRTEWVLRAQRGPCWPQSGLNLELDFLLK